MKSLLIVAILFVLTPLMLEGQPTVEQYRDFPEAGRTGYVVGWYGGFMYAFLNFIEPRPEDAWTWHLFFGAEVFSVDVKMCIEEWTFGHMQAVFDTYVEEHPEIWQEHARVHMGLSVLEACDPDGTGTR